MASSFIPANGTGADDRTVENDGWYPDLTVAECRAETSLATIFGTDRIAAELLAAAIEINAGIAEWRALQSAASLAEVPAASYGTVSAKIALYKRAVHTLARARMVDTTRDYDASGKGHDRADALEDTAEVWRQASQEALARLTGRARTVVELI